MKQPFESVVTTHGETVLRLCRSRVSPTDADDAWSETFLAALRAYPSLPETANLEAWLVTIAKRKCIDVHRATSRNALPVKTLPDAATDLGVPGASDPDLWGAVDRLPDKQRQAITHRYLGGLAHSEIAAIIGGSPDASRRAVADGLKNLRKAPP